MKKRKTKEKSTDKLSDAGAEAPKQNPVAKFAGMFNRAKVIDDKSTYKRKQKHSKQDDYEPDKE